VLENQVRPLVEQFLAVRGLELSADKTVVTHIEQGFDFLGQNVRKYKGKLLIKPSKASIRSVLREARRIMRTSGSLTAGQLVARLNPVLRGWAYYHRHVVSSHTFASIDNRIWCNLFRWARRRHKRQSFRWIHQTYFLPHEGRHHVFTGSVTVGTSSGLRTVRIFRMASLPIQRHLLIRGAANPLDPAWDAYYQQRRRSRMIRSAVEPRPVTRADVEA
jgi:RNA-directed DNA polymerase